MVPTGTSEPVRMAPGPLGDRTFDDAFDGLAERAEFTVQGAGRRVAVRFGGSYRLAPGLCAARGRVHLVRADDRAHQLVRVGPPAPGGAGRAYRAQFEIVVADA
jgi:hypothetical protein